jgi:ATP-dependent protease ClpP protease subunit
MPADLNAGMMPDFILPNTLRELRAMIPEDRYLSIVEDDLSDEYLRVKLKELEWLAEVSSDPILLSIHSEGGHLGRARDISRFLRTTEVPVIGVAARHCYSSALLILLGCKYRVASSSATFLVHNPVVRFAFEINGSVTRAKLHTLVDSAFDHFESEQRVVRDLVSSCSFLEQDKVFEIMNKGEILSAQTAFEYGFLDKVY